LYSRFFTFVVRSSSFHALHEQSDYSARRGGNRFDMAVQQVAYLATCRHAEDLILLVKFYFLRFWQIYVFDFRWKYIFKPCL
jgi:hypothetical protein